MTGARDTLADRLGQRLARKLNEPSPGFLPYTHANVAALRRMLQPGDVLLVEGNTRISVAIKYLTHVDLVACGALRRQRARPGDADGEPLSLIEVNVGEGCIAAPLSKYELYNTRICRANEPVAAGPRRG